MTILSVLAGIFGVGMSLANLPQAYKIFKRKSAKDISPITYTTFTIGGLIWLFYGIELKNSAIIISNAIGTLTVVIVLIGWMIYGRNTDNKKIKNRK